MILVPGRKTVDPEPYFLWDCGNKKLLGPFDPGVIHFETPRYWDNVTRKVAARVHDSIINAAYAGADRFLRTIIGDQKVDLIRLLGAAGMFPVDIEAYLGNGVDDEKIAGVHIDDSKNGTNIAGVAGGTGVSADSGTPGLGLGRGGGGTGSSDAAAKSGGGGGGYGAVGTAGTDVGLRPGDGGLAVPDALVFDALRQNSFTQAILGYGSGGGAGGGNTGGAGGNGSIGGSNYIEISIANLSTVARTLTGTAGVNASGDRGGGGGGAGGLSLLVAVHIIYGSGTINTSGGAGGSNGGGSGGAGGAGANGRVIQVFFRENASLTVSGATESSFRIIRPIPTQMRTYRKGIL